MQTVWIIVIILVVIALGVGGYFLYRKESYGPTGHIAANQVLTPSSARELVLFSSPSCPHCKALAPTWSEVVDTLKGKMKVTEVGPSDPRMMEQRPPGVPCIRVYPQGIGAGNFVEYKGDRSKDSILAFAMQA